MNELIDVLSVWWIKVVIDITIVCIFIRVAKERNNHDKSDSNNGD